MVTGILERGVRVDGKRGVRDGVRGKDGGGGEVSLGFRIRAKSGVRVREREETGVEVGMESGKRIVAGARVRTGPGGGSESE